MNSTANNKFALLVDKTKDLVTIQNELTIDVINNYINPIINDKIKTNNILDIVIYLMREIENYDIENSNKKLLIINIVRKIVYKYENLIEISDKAHDFIDYFLPSLIDKIILIDKGKIKVTNNNFLNKIYNYFKF
jgi:hypothetical protein